MQIIKTLPPFIRNVTAEDFNAVDGLRYISQSGRVTETDPWNKYSPLSPKQVFALVTQDLPGKPTLSLDLCDSGAMMADLGEEGDAYEDGRQIDLCDRTLDHGTVEVKKNKGRGTGRLLLRNYIELGAHLNCRGFNILAGSSNGAYFWARAGIPLKPEEIHRESGKKRVLRERLEQFNGIISDELYQEVSNLIQLNDIYDINKIADLSYIVDRDKLVIDENLTIVAAAGEVNRLANLFTHNKDRGGVTLGQHLLDGLMYDGYLDFSDERAMLRVEAYVGGFKTISLCSERGQMPKQPELAAKQMALTA